ncbi:MAG TPA: nitroreductase family protein, partial [Bacteroidota bacterium]|nr:nitroreductase family protein [Bacteroidota bacterium]
MQIDELLTVLKERRSIRAFSGEAVSAEEIQMLLEAAQAAPSNSNRQGWKFLVIKNDGIKRQMADAVEQKVLELGRVIIDAELRAAFDSYARYLTFFTKAPVVIAALSKRSPSFLETISRETGMDLPIGTGQAELMSVSMAIQNLQLAAH